jgi:hypothetical protein
MSGDVAREMPKYKCHKEVWALKIAKLEPCSDGGALITPAEVGYAVLGVSSEYVSKHQPKVGGYFVVYKDGYQSWSPASEFEDGYTAVR